MQKIIVNSTPIITLGKIGKLGIFKGLYGEIIIPQAVYDEINVGNDAAGRAVDSADWIKVKQITGNPDRSMYRARLHAGEVEVMILARQIQADMVIIDDNEAKKTAKYLGLDVTGTLGILIVEK